MNETSPLVATLETNLTPPLTIDLSGEAGDDTFWLARLLQPTLRGRIPFTEREAVIAPWGAANGQLGTVIFVAVLALAGYGAWRLFR